MDLKTQKQIASNIRYLRKVFGYTQYDLADVVHLSRCTYAQFESGKKIPTADTLLTLAEFYNVSVDTILQIDARRVINDVIFSDRCKQQITHLLDMYYRLSPDNQTTLLDKAHKLILEEQAGLIPSHHIKPIPRVQE